MTDVVATDLARTFPGRPPVAALRGVDLEVPSGSVVAVLGPSGCGKTTLLRILAGFERPDRGSVSLGGEVVSSPQRLTPPERRRVGIVPQEGALFPHLDVAGNVAFGLRGTARDERRVRVGEVLDLVGLPGFERRRPHELSGGQQQRVALARALAPRPAVVLLDEPFTALDAGLRGSLREDVAETLAAAKATALLVTHDQSEALSMADHLAVMRRGRIVQVGPPAEVYQRPADLEVATFLGDAVVLPGERSGPTVTCALGTVPVTSVGAGDAPGPTAPARGPVAVCLRPEQLRRDDASPRRAVVRGLRYQGHDALVDLQVGDRVVRARWSSVDLPTVDEEVGLEVVGTAMAFPPPP